MRTIRAVAQAREETQRVATGKPKAARRRTRLTFWLQLALLATAFCFGPREASAEESEDGADLLLGPLDDDEGLLFRDIASVVSASLFEEKLLTAPSSITVLTGEDLRRTGARDMPDALSWLPGIDVVPFNAYQSTVSARGFANRTSVKMLALLDGVALYTPFTGDVYWEYYPGFLENVDSVEVIRGPGGALYGANAFCGVVSIVPREIAPEGPRTALSFRGGSQGVADLTAITENRRWNGAAWRVSAGLVSDKGCGGFDGTENPDSRIQAKLGAELTVPAGPDASISCRAHVLSALHDHNDPAIPEEVGNTSSVLSVRYERGGEDRSFRIQAFDTLMTARTDSGNRIDVRTDDLSLGLSSHIGERHRLVYGCNVRTSESEDNWLTSPGRHSYASAGAFAQDTAALSDALTMTTGVKAEWEEEISWMIAPRAAVVYAPSGVSSWRLTYGRAYRTPSITERMIDHDDPTYTILGNEDLAPEKIDTLEIGNRRFSGKTKFDVVLFYEQADDLIDRVLVSMVPRPTVRYMNVASAEGYGGEVNVRTDIGRGTRASLGYSYKHLVNKDTGERLGFGSGHKADLGIEHMTPGGIGVGLSLGYVGEKDTLDYSAGEMVEIDGHLRLDARCAVPFADGRGEFAVGGQHLLDNKTRAGADLEVDRALYVTLSHVF